LKDVPPVVLYFPWKSLKGKITMTGRQIAWTACSTNVEERNACRLLVGKPEVKIPLARPRRRWVDNIKRDLRVMMVLYGGLIWLRIGTSAGLV
jgi:hypothetical protein